MKEFAERLKDLRTDRNLSLRQLAELTNISYSAIEKWESQARVPNAEAVVALAKFFGVTTDYLLGLTD